MNKFELFTMIFYAIDLYYDENPSELLGQFLSEMSPFTFTDIGSADPAVYKKFCDFVNDDITIDNSYNIALEYVRSIQFFDLDLAPIFQSINVDKWKSGCEEYLASDHKGKTSQKKEA